MKGGPERSGQVACGLRGPQGSLAAIDADNNNSGHEVLLEINERLAVTNASGYSAAMASRRTGASRRTPSRMDSGGTALNASRILLEGSSEWVKAAPGMKTTPASMAFFSSG